MAIHNDLGKAGETLAAEYLASQGYAIVERDTRKGHFEIDIVAMKGPRIVFVEVKSRTEGLSDPLDAIDAKKISRICSAADTYVKLRNIPHEVQFDIITVVFTPDGSHRLTHIPDAFRPPLRTSR